MSISLDLRHTAPCPRDRNVVRVSRDVFAVSCLLDGCSVSVCVRGAGPGWGRRAPLARLGVLGRRREALGLVRSPAGRGVARGGALERLRCYFLGVAQAYMYRVGWST